MSTILLVYKMLIVIALLIDAKCSYAANDSLFTDITSKNENFTNSINNDSIALEAHIQKVRALRRNFPSQALDHANQALFIAKELKHQEQIAKILTDLAYLNWRLSNYKVAVDKLEEAISIFEKTGGYSGYARALNIKGGIYSDKGFNEKALQYYFNALSNLEMIDSIARTAAILNNIAIIYLDMGDYDRAEEFNKRSLVIKEEFENERGIAFSLNNLGIISQRRGNYKEALDYFESSLSIRKKADHTRGIANTKRNIGCLHYEQGDFDKAIYLLTKARNIYDQLEDAVEIAQIDHYLGRVYFAKASLQPAQSYYMASLDVAERVGLLPLIIKNYKKLGALMALENNFETAYYYQGKYIKLQDSLYAEESRQRALEMKMMYDRERKESEISLLRKSNQIKELNIEKQRLLRNFLIIFIVLTFIILYIIYNRYTAYKKTNKLLKHQKDRITQYNDMLKGLNSSLLSQKEKVDQLNDQLKKSQQNLIDINNTKDQFFSIISHDLRSPFASIVSFSRIMKRDIDNLSKEELQQLAAELDKSVNKINNLLDNLLQWSRSQTGKIIYQPIRFKLKDTIIENINLFRAIAHDKNIELTDRVDPETEVWADVNMCDTIIRNLLSNAIKYTNEGGSVVISSDLKGDMVEVSVADTGVGISPDDQKKLFRADNLHSTFGTKDEKGSGLGLLLCKGFVKKQGGRIRMKSTPGAGSVFSFTLPLAK